MARVGHLGIWALGAAALVASSSSCPAQSVTTGSSGAVPGGDGRTGTPDRTLCQTLSSSQTKIRFRKKRFDLRDREDLQRLATALDAEIQALDRADRQGEDPDPDGNESHGKSDRRALMMMRSLASRALTTEPAPCEAILEIAEIGDSLDLDAQPPVPRRLDLVQVPFYYLNLRNIPVAEGKEPAANLAPVTPSSAAASPPSPAATGSSDSSLRDPLPSTFWSRPKDIASLDVYHEFGTILQTGPEPCLYDEPKTSYGTTPGFSIKCGDRVIKVKFGAVKFGEPPAMRDSEVTVTRLFGALGFHVEPNDYAPEIRLRYDRRILLEFNSRKDLTMTITALGFIPVYRLKVQSAIDPFSFIRSAVMKDGRVLSPEALAEKLIRTDVLERSDRASKKSPKGTLPEHYREDAAAFERDIDHLVLKEANIQLRKSGGENIGPWGWDRLDHARRRELRGSALLSAWTNYFDVRWDNNRLKFTDEGAAADAGGAAGTGGGTDGAGGAADHDGVHVDAPGDAGTRILHFISDLGGGLGRAESYKVDEGNLVNDFPWTFTEAPVKDGNGRETRPFRIVGYKPVFRNEAFREMTVDDARWMARLIAQLTENQIGQSLVAGGYTSAEIKVYTEKLISRRDKMVEDLGLVDEVPLLRPGGTVRTFDYDPFRDGPVRVKAADGSDLRPMSSRDLVVRGGRVEPR